MRFWSYSQVFALVASNGSTQRVSAHIFALNCVLLQFGELFCQLWIGVWIGVCKIHNVIISFEIICESHGIIVSASTYAFLLSLIKYFLFDFELFFYFLVNVLKVGDVPPIVVPPYLFLVILRLWKYQHLHPIVEKRIRLGMVEQVELDWEIRSCISDSEEEPYNTYNALS